MFLQQLVNGITIGSTYALVAIGYSLIFGVLQLINFSNGSVYMLGGYLTLLVYLALKGNFLIAFFISLLITGLVGFLVDFFGLRLLRKKNAPRMAGLISTLGIGTIIDNSIQIWFGTETKSFPNFFDYGKITIGNTIISWTQIIILITSFLLMTIFSLLVYKTKMGKSMRAVAQNMAAAKLMGIDVKKVVSYTFIISAFLACIAGTLVGSYYQTIDTTMGFSVGMKTFAAAVLGGVGSLPGAMIGGLIVGIAETLGASYLSSGYRDAIAFIILIMVLLIKPSGIFGKQKIEKM
ncbi:MAG: inner-rane translocator [Anaerocolumna sp.]|jgi:branched-chain amino acid transport system permease protein|nr:inner-rane translocator [Anaerocolumna sp.]